MATTTRKPRTRIGHLCREAGRIGPVVGAAATAVTLMIGSAPAVSAQDGVTSRVYSWADREQTQHVPIDDPWGVRGWTNYVVTTQPVCWTYAGRPNAIVAEAWVSAPDRFPAFPADPRSLLLRTHETVTVDWTNTTTGRRGREVFHGEDGTTIAGIESGPGVIDMDIHVRTDNPALLAVGSAHLPFGHSEGSVHARVDVPGGTCS